MKKLFTFSVILLVFFGVFTSNGQAGVCTTQYPILLLHGIAIPDNLLGFNYFGRVPNYLRSKGAIVEGGGQDAWDNNDENAKQIKNKIYEVCAAYNVSKVNIIAHSKGGLDTRAMFKKYPWMKSKVASFTTIATPHRGSVLADILLGAIPDWAESYVGDMVNVIGLIIEGDESPNSLSAGYQLKRANMASFNNSLGDLSSGISGVYCQSYAAKIKGVVLDPMLQASGIVMSIGGESPNDGAVWTNSAKYAHFKGVKSGAWWCGGVTHFGIVDRGIGLLSGYTPGFDARGFYKNIVIDLKNRGY